MISKSYKEGLNNSFLLVEMKVEVSEGNLLSETMLINIAECGNRVALAFLHNANGLKGISHNYPLNRTVGDIQQS